MDVIAVQDNSLKNWEGAGMSSLAWSFVQKGRNAEAATLAESAARMLHDIGDDSGAAGAATILSIARKNLDTR
jgi:hypothetical protein